MQAQPRLLAPQVSPRLHRYSLHIGILSILGNGSLSRLFYPWVFVRGWGRIRVAQSHHFPAPVQAGNFY